MGAVSLLTDSPSFDRTWQLRSMHQYASLLILIPVELLEACSQLIGLQVLEGSGARDLGS